jgi:hypothetical protein
MSRGLFISGPLAFDSSVICRCRNQATVPPLHDPARTTRAQEKSRVAPVGMTEPACRERGDADDAAPQARALVLPGYANAARNGTDMRAGDYFRYWSIQATQRR